MSKHAPLLALLALAACGAPPEPATPPPPTTAAASASAAPSASATAPPAPAPPAPFSVVAELPFRFQLHRVEGALLLVADTPLSADELPLVYGSDPPKLGGEEDSAVPVGVLEKGKVRFPKVAAFRLRWSHIVGAAGRWPDAVRLLATTAFARSGMAEQWMLGDQGWKARPGGTPDHAFVGAAASGGRTYAMQIPLMSWPGHLGSASIVDLDGKAAPFKLTPAAKDRCTGEGGLRQAHAVMPASFAGTTDGTLVSVGSSCEDTWAVEVWKPGARTSQIQVFPGHPATDAGLHPILVPGLDKDLWMLASFVARYDGASWKELGPTPDRARVTSAVVTADGKLWALDEAAKLHRFDGGRWETVPLPPDVKAEELAVDEGELLVAAYGLLLRHGAPGAPPAPRADKPAAGAKPPVHRLPRAGGPRCPHNLVLLYAFTKMTPDDYDFPLTRKAVKGHAELAGVRFVVTRDFGQKFFAAQVPSFDAGKKLLSLIEKEVKGSKPQLLCAEPEVLREVKIDLRTGEVQK